MRPTLLDLFCGAGGAAMGYYRAGLDVVGVDINPQPRYPFEFIQADALEYLADCGKRFDYIHASPPCQGFSVTSSLPWTRGYKGDIPDLLTPCRRLLIEAGKPYVIENVPSAPMTGITLCGTMFGLKLFRHRIFESSEFLLQPPHSAHREKIGENGYVGIYGHGDGGRGRIPANHRSKAAWQKASGIAWMTMQEMAESIPPAYTEFIGGQLLTGGRTSE